MLPHAPRAKQDPYAVPERSDFEADVLAGFAATPKRIPPKYFYDTEGSRLFEAITRQPEYYPTRTETGILKAKARELAGIVPANPALIEFGSGACTKVRILCDAVPGLAAFVPVDISGPFLNQHAAELGKAYPRLAIHPVAADFTKPFSLPPAVRDLSKTGFFPGSTIGNFEPEEAAAFLRLVRDVLGAHAFLVVGVDLVKDEATLDVAYNDAAGITAKFNLNLLRRINRELQGGFDLGAFRHRAFFNSARSRIEMHLVSAKEQTVAVAGRSFSFAAGESIHTENSYKYSLDSFAALARHSGWAAHAAWTDPDRLFSVHVLRAV